LAALSKNENLALWLGPRVLLILILLVPAALQYGDIAEVLHAHRSCSGTIQTIIAFVAGYYPTSIYLVTCTAFAVLCLVRLSFAAAACSLLFIIGFNILPQFYVVCS